VVGDEGDGVAFIDNDPLEDDMGVRCEDMNPDQLVAYVKSYQAAFGLNLKVEGFKERGVFRGMQRIYGTADAGRIVKWAFYHHKGQLRGEPIGFFVFSKGNKWWTDKLYMEVQQEMRKSTGSSYQGATLGVRSLSDL
jgi:hypothetical protein